MVWCAAIGCTAHPVFPFPVPLSPITSLLPPFPLFLPPPSHLHPSPPQAAATALPHPEKAAAGLKGVNRKGGGYGGEDAYFYCTNR